MILLTKEITMLTKFIPVEAVLNIYEARWWMYIEGFNGYELSQEPNGYCYLRSMKHYKKYPYGILIRPKTQGEDPVFTLSNNNNERVDVHLSELLKIAKNPTRAVSEYPRPTITTDNTSRNDRHFVKKKNTLPPLDNEPHYAKFTIIDGE